MIGVRTARATPHATPAPFHAKVSPQPLYPRSTMIGGIRETQEMLDFCGQHGIASDIEMIRMDQINEAYARMLKSDLKYRFVIDMASLNAD